MSVESAGSSDSAKFATSDLYRPLRTYVEGALSLLGEALRDHPQAFTTLEWPAWHRDDDGIFRDTGAHVVWSTALERQIEALPAHDLAVDALRADPAASAHLDVLVGTRRSGSMLQTSMFLRGLVNSSTHARTGFTFQSELFDVRFREFVDWLGSDTVETVTLVPLSGVAGNCSGPVVLSAATELDPLTDAEVMRALSVGAIRPFGGIPIFSNEPSVWGIRVRHREAKLVGQAAFDDPGEHAELIRQDELTSLEIERALTTLRVHKKGRFNPVARLTFADGEGPGQGTSFSFLSPDFHTFGTYDLSEADRAGLEELARNIAERGVRQRPYVENALRRFSFAGERRRADDRLLDLMIAAESLFLGHLQEREGELRFRLSLHAGHLLGTRPDQRRDIAKHMRRAYETRSAIVHGGTPSPEKWGSTAARPLSLEEFTERTEDLMREAVRAAIELAAGSPGTRPFFDWEAAIFDRGRTSTS